MRNRSKTSDRVSITESSLRELVEDGEITVGPTHIEVMSHKEFRLEEE